MQVSEYLRKSTLGYTHWCPACKCPHHIAVDQPNPKGSVWKCDSDLNKPTFSPSVLIRYHDKQDTVTGICHYNLVAGKLHYQSDCTHGLAGQSVALPELPPGLRDKE